jgi:hypothetical protein
MIYSLSSQFKKNKSNNRCLQNGQFFNEENQRFFEVFERTDTRGFFDADVVTSVWWVFAFVNNH